MEKVQERSFESRIGMQERKSGKGKLELYTLNWNHVPIRSQISHNIWEIPELHGLYRNYTGHIGTIRVISKLHGSYRNFTGHTGTLRVISKLYGSYRNYTGHTGTTRVIPELHGSYRNFTGHI